MPVFVCRWPNGDVSLVSARNKEDAIMALDEFDDAEIGTLMKVENLLLDFRLADNGELVFQGFGDECHAEIIERVYPAVAQALADAPRTVAGELRAKGKLLVARAVEAEKKRPLRKTPKVAETALGKAVQRQLGASSVLVNRRMQDVATRVLERLPNSGRKQ
jgi:hypothetical protein